MGRIGPVLPITRQDFVAKIKKALGVEQVLVAGPLEGALSKVAVAAGAVGDLLRHAIHQEAQAVVCGEIRHHDALMAAAHGVTVICARHSCSERKALTPLRERLAERHPEVRFLLSRHDHDPLQFV
jgi:putative NIF3 family GTP cyclohydrolase 1 type 2